MSVVLLFGHQIIQLFSTDVHIVHLATFMLKVTMTSLLLNGIGFYSLVCYKLQVKDEVPQLWRY